MSRCLCFLFCLVLSRVIPSQGQPLPGTMVPQYPRQSPSEHLVFSLTKSVASDEPKLTFKLFALQSFSNFYYRIEVWSGDDSAKLQETGEIRNGIEIEGHKERFRVEDYNADGYSDIMLLGGVDKSGKVDKPWYKVWLYRPATKSFDFKP